METEELAKKWQFEPRKSELTLTDLAIAFGALGSDMTKRLGRIERNMISFEKALRAVSPEFDKALNEVIASNKKQ